jgi:hypothetical protein
VSGTDVTLSLRGSPLHPFIRILTTAGLTHWLFAVSRQNMSFKFIENGKIDGAARKRIRSHVMKGKNVGKVRARATRIGESEVGTLHYHRRSCAADPIILTRSKDTYGDMTEILSTPRAVGNSFSLLSFPCELQPYMRDLISRCKNKPTFSMHIYFC